MPESLDGMFTEHSSRSVTPLQRITDRLLAGVPRARIDRVVSHLPPWGAAVLARLLVSPRDLRPFPGWHFGAGYETEDSRLAPTDRIRRSVWEYFKERGPGAPIPLRWVLGLKVRTHLGNDTSWPLFVGGCVEPNEMATLHRAVAPGMVFVDVGANEGLFTILGARLVGPSGTVLAIEPSSRECERLKANLELNRLRNVRVQQLGLSNRDGYARLRIAEDRYPGHNTLGDFVFPAIACQSVEEVPITMLDRLVESENLHKVDVVKIDVEGAETAVLEGAAQTLERFRPLLIVEVLDPALRLQGSSEVDLLGSLAMRGYEAWGFDLATGLPGPLGGDRLTPYTVVAVHRERPRDPIVRPEGT